jgi:hypothetical protein
VGTGTGTSNRRTGLWITSGSVTNVSGSMNVIGQTIMSSSTSFPLYVSGTMQTQRLHFEGNPFNADVSSNLAALRIAGNNTVFNISMYDNADITTSSYVVQTVDTGSAYVATRLEANNRGQSYNLTLNNQSGTGSLTTNANVIITGSLAVTNLPNATGSFFVMSDAAGTITEATPQQAILSAFAAGAFYSTGSVTTTANASGSFVYDSTVDSQGITYSGSQITVSRTGLYNIQFSTQIDNGSGAADVAIWLKKNGSNIADTSTILTVPSNHKDVLALNLWDNATAGDYYELTYQSNSSSTSFATIAASGNIPRSPGIIVTINQIR